MTGVTPGAVVVREAVPADAEAIGEVHGAAWSAAYPSIFAAADLAQLVSARRRDRWPATFAGAAFGATTLLVAERAGVVVGFLHGGPTRDAPDDGRGEVYSFNVHPTAWGSGAAGALLGAACAILAGQGHGVVHLWTFQDAPQARRFYEKSGFDLTGRTKKEGPAGVPPVTEIEYTRAVGPDGRISG